MRDSGVFYRSFYEAINDCPEEIRLKLYDAIMQYMFEGKESELDGMAKSLWRLMKPQIEANNRKYENGSKGGRPKKKNQNETKTKPSENQTESKRKGNDNDNVNEKEKVDFFDFNSVFKSPDDVLKIVGDKYEHIMIYNDVQQYAFNQSITTTKAKWKTLIKNWATRNGNKYERQPLPIYLRKKL